MKLIIDECFNDLDGLILKNNAKLERYLQDICKAISSTIGTMNKKTAERILDAFKEGGV